MANQPSVPDPLGFARRLWGNMGLSLPGMVTPTLDVEELEKKISDLRAVENWLKMNLSMLQMTIQGLEMQCITLNAVRAMGQMASGPHPGSEANQGATAGNDILKQAALWPWNLMQQLQEQMQQAAAAARALPTTDNGKPAVSASEGLPARPLRGGPEQR